MRRLCAVAVVCAIPAGTAQAQATIDFGGALGNRYSPDALRVTPGTEVTWSGDFDAHPLRSSTAGFSWDGPGDYVRPFPEPGRFGYYCEVHQGSGMDGEVVVTANTPPSAAISASPSGTVAAGTTVTFDARGSSDPGGSVAGHAWDLDGDGSFDDATGETASRAYAQTTRVGVRVTDDNSDPIGPESDTAFVDVVVAGSPAPPPPGGGTAPPPLSPTGPPAGGGADTVAPVVRVVARSLRFRRGRAVLAVRLSETARVTATLRRRGVRLASGTGAARVALRLTRAGRRALRGGRMVPAALTLRAVDAAGNARVTRHALRIRAER